MHLIPCECRPFILLAMKLFTLFSIILTLQVSAEGYGQSIQLHLTNAPLEKAFREIKKQSGYSFIYTRAQIKRANPVSCALSNATLSEALTACFQNQQLSFVIEDKYVVVQNRPDEKVEQSQPLEVDVSGKIVGEKNQPIQGVSITVKGKGKGTSTNEAGEFLLQSIPSNSILIISSVGYLTQELAIGKNSFMMIRMEIEVGNLEETVIKGYYSTSRKLNTGSVVKISSTEISKQPVSNPIAALEGRVSGLFITQGTGLPGSNFSVLLRGKNSIQNGNSPLYIIDGVPFLSDADRLTQFNGTNTGNPFNSINPDDIQSIEILKDADATAIYGSRGANGVILITTKSGKAGKTKVDLKMYTGWGKISRSYHLMNTPQYVEMRKEAFKNDNVEPDNSNAYDLLVWDTTHYTDWKKELIGNNAHSNNVQLRISGGSAGTNFTLGANYYKETTVYPTNDIYDRRIVVSLGLNHQSADEKFKMSVSGSLANDKNNLIQTDLIQYILIPPNTPETFDVNGKLLFSKDGFTFSNPYAAMLQTYSVNTNRLNTSASLSYQFVRQLGVKLSLGYNSVQADELGLLPIASQNPDYSPLGGSNFASRELKSWIVEPQLEYKVNAGSKGHFNALLGGTLQATTSSSFALTAYGFSNDAQLKDISALPPTNIYNTKSNSQYKYLGFYARLNFDWAEKYLLNFTGRRDGSSRFAPENQFANFGAIGVGWIFSKESFLKRGPFSFGKLRASFGITGNDRIGDYQYMDSWMSGSPYQGLPALRPTKLYNADFGWEAIRKTELAMELGFWKSRLFFNLNAFSNVSDNQLIRYNLPAQTGFNYVLRNFPGKVQNRGLEFEVSADLIKSSGLNWNTRLNLTISQNKLVSFPGLETSSYASDFVVGKSLNAIQGYKFEGVNAETGVYQFADLNKDGSITPREGNNWNDYIYLGTTEPAYYGGWENNLSYKGWSFSFLFQFVNQKGRDAIYGNSSPSGYMLNAPQQVLNRWQSSGDLKPYQRYSQEYGEVYTAQYMVSQSDAAITNASYIRLKTMSLSYMVDEKKLKALGLESFRFFFQCQNPFVITSYKELDPENQSFYSLPPLRMFTIGFQMTL